MQTVWRWMASAILVLLTIAPGRVAVSGPCYLGPTCGECIGGRAYVPAGGIYCTVCWNFCVPPAPQDGQASVVAPTQTVQVSAVDTSERILFIETPVALIRALAYVNPEAAEILYVMNMRSRESPNYMPTIGHGTATKLMSPEALELQLTSKASDEAFKALLKEIPAPGTLSKATWTLGKAPGGVASLTLTHRVLNAAEEELPRLYPDIKISLRWVATGKSGYWQAIRWEGL
jgi:hypothetical protein